MPKGKRLSEKASSAGNVQGVAYATGKSKSPMGEGGYLPYSAGKVSSGSYRAKAAKSMIRKGR